MCGGGVVRKCGGSRGRGAVTTSRGSWKEAGGVRRNCEEVGEFFLYIYFY